MKNKIIISALIVALIAIGYVANIVFLPRIKVENLAGQFIKQVEVNLPSSKLVFSSITEGSIHIQKHSPNQTDGTYKYNVLFNSGTSLVGECGYITSNEFGKMFLLTVRSEKEVTCNS